MADANWNEAPSTNDLRNSYDEIPYTNAPQPYTHISRIAAVGQLRGMMPPSPARCRVLELGCADGGNLLPMAVRYSESQFVGIDLSPTQVKTGSERARELALPNFELRSADILELNEQNLEHFDYIIAHGVYSWVPVEVRERILQICQNHLTQNGIAYLSYNVYPGWRSKQALREILRYHTRNIVDLRKKVEASFELLSIMPLPDTSPNAPAPLLVQQLREKLEEIEDPATYLLHEYLIDLNEPFYFTEFLRQIGTAGLQYVDDVYPGSTSLDRLPPLAQNWAREHLTEYSEQQQYVDFFGNTAFRRSLICHDSLVIERKLTMHHMRSLRVMALCQIEPSEDNVRYFKTKSGRRFTMDHSGLLAVLDRLVAACPESVPLSEIRDILGDRVSDDQAVEMIEALLNGSVIEFTVDDNRCTRTVEERPFASRLVRHQSERGFASNASHRAVRIDNPFNQQLIPLLDGRSTVPELASLLRERLSTDKPISDTEWEVLVREQLSRIADMGLLEKRTETQSTSLDYSSSNEFLS